MSALVRLEQAEGKARSLLGFLVRSVLFCGRFPARMGLEGWFDLFLLVDAGKGVSEASNGPTSTGLTAGIGYAFDCWVSIGPWSGH